MKAPKKELDKIKKWIIKNYGEEHKGFCIGCIVCQVWRAIDILQKALEFGEDEK